jgi:hypothetical protein
MVPTARLRRIVVIAVVVVVVGGGAAVAWAATRPDGAAYRWRPPVPLR